MKDKREILKDLNMWYIYTEKNIEKTKRNIDFAHKRKMSEFVIQRLNDTLREYEDTLVDIQNRARELTDNIKTIH